jgi:hypothetical protein
MCRHKTGAGISASIENHGSRAGRTSRPNHAVGGVMSDAAKPSNHSGGKAEEKGQAVKSLKQLVSAGNRESVNAISRIR